MVKQFLSQNSVRYDEKDVSRSREYAEELVKNTGQMGVPVTVSGSDVIVGFNKPELQRLVDRMKAADQQAAQQKEANRTPSFGAAIADAKSILESKHMDPVPGAYIGRVKDTGLADTMGLIPGDVITQAGGLPVTNAADLERFLSGLRKTDRFSMEYRRGTRVIRTEGTW